MGLLGIDPICSIYPKPNFTLLPEIRNLDVINYIFIWWTNLATELIK